MKISLEMLIHNMEIRMPHQNRFLHIYYLCTDFSHERKAYFPKTIELDLEMLATDLSEFWP